MSGKVYMILTDWLQEPESDDNEYLRKEMNILMCFDT